MNITRDDDPSGGWLNIFEKLCAWIFVWGFWDCASNISLCLWLLVSNMKCWFAKICLFFFHMSAVLFFKLKQIEIYYFYSFLLIIFSAGMLSTLRHIYLENGVVKGLYRGMSINYLRAIPMVAVSFSTYEVLKQALNLDTGMKI